MATGWEQREEVLQRFLLGFSGTSLPDELATLLAGGLSGVAIYRRNYDDPAGLRALTTAIRRMAGRPVLIGMDQEGGEAAFALPPPFTTWPSAADLGTLLHADAGKGIGHDDDAPRTMVGELVEQVARAMARELRAVGCNLDFAPMMDLPANAASPVTAGRAFSGDSRAMAAYGVAFLRGLAAEGVLGCAKHFPGHGDADVDPHFDLPRSSATREGLLQRDLVPFAAAIAEGVPMVMTAHVLLPHVDPNRPASISQRALELLRRELGFDGAILADDLGMGAIARRYGTGESVVKTIEAGTDIAMLCHNDAAIPEAIAALAESAQGGRFGPAQWAAARARIARLRERIRDAERPAPPLDVIGCAEHRDLAAEIQSRVNRAARQ